MKKLILFLLLITFLSPRLAFCEITPAAKEQVEAAQAQMMNDPEIMSDIQEMMKDPEMVKLLTDPELMKKVTSHDLEAIAKDPKAQELMRNPKMLELIQKMQSKVSSQQ